MTGLSRRREGLGSSESEQHETVKMEKYLRRQRGEKGGGTGIHGKIGRNTGVRQQMPHLQRCL